MSYSNQDWRTAITKLLKQTSKKDVNWEAGELKRIDAWTEVDRSFETTINGKTFVVSQTRSKYYHDEEDWSWAGGLHFGVYKKSFDGYELVAAAPEGLSVVSSLYSAAESSYAYASEALKDLLD